MKCLPLFSLISTAIALALFGGVKQANAADPWQAGSVSFTKWEEVSRSCDEWLPLAEEVDWGRALRQSSRCDITEERIRLQTEVNALTREVRDASKKTERRRLAHARWRTSTGLKDRVVSADVAGEWTAWSVVPGTATDCRWIMPALDKGVDLNVPWTRAKVCRADVARHRPVYDYWLSGKATEKPELLLSEGERRDVVLTELSVGDNDRWITQSPVYSNWRDVSEKVCAEWSGVSKYAASRPWGESYLISRQCNVEQQRTKTVNRKRLSGQVARVSQDQERREYTKWQWRTLYGRTDAVLSAEWTLVKDWHKDDTTLTCPPSLSAELVPIGETFIHYATCTIKNKRVYHYEAKRLSGQVTIDDVREDFESLPVVRLAMLQGRQDRLLERSAEVKGSDWQPGGSPVCNDWSPMPQSVDFGVVHQQYRSCDQVRYRTIERLERWASGDRWVQDDRISDTLSYLDVRLALGSKIRTLSSGALRFLTSANSVWQTEPFVIDGSDRFSRVRVILPESVVRKVDVVRLYGPGGHVDAPVEKSRRGLVYIDVSGFSTHAGAWHIRLDGVAGEDLQGTSLSLLFLSQ